MSGLGMLMLRAAAVKMVADNKVVLDLLVVNNKI